MTAPQRDYPDPLPIAIEAEQQLLGAILVNNAALSVVSGFLTPEHFYERIHAETYAAICQLRADGRVVTPVTLKGQLVDLDISAIGMTLSQYLAKLAVSATTVVNTKDYAEEIVDTWRKRQMIGIANEVDALCRNGDGVAQVSASVIAQDALVQLHALAEQAGARSTRVQAGAGAISLIERIHRIHAGEERPDGVASGIPELDRSIGGFMAGELVVLAGRPGMGKTVAGLSFARRVADHVTHRESPVRRDGVMFFGLEIGEAQTTARLLADMSYIARKPLPFGAIQRGSVDPNDMWRLENAAGRLREMPLTLDCPSRLSVAEISTRVRAEKERMAKAGVRLRLVVIDYLKFIKLPEGRDPIAYKIGQITGALKALAKDEAICVLLLTQLNRVSANRDVKDKRPILADLRDSGEIEQDADAVIFIHREAYWIKESAEFRACDPAALEAYAAMEHHAELIIGKARSGETKTVNIWADVGSSTIAAEARREMI